MENNLKNVPCKTGKANLEQPELDIATSEEAVKNMKNSGVDKPEIKTAEMENRQLIESAIKNGLAEKSDGKIDHVLPQKDNPDFEPEFDGDLAHVSWLSMKPFGDKKGF